MTPPDSFENLGQCYICGSAVVKQLTHYPRFQGLSTASVGTGKQARYFSAKRIIQAVLKLLGYNYSQNSLLKNIRKRNLYIIFLNFNRNIFQNVL